MFTTFNSEMSTPKFHGRGTEQDRQFPATEPFLAIFPFLSRYLSGVFPSFDPAPAPHPHCGTGQRSRS